MSSLEEEVKKLKVVVERLAREVEELKSMEGGREGPAPHSIRRELIEKLLLIFEDQFKVKGSGGIAFVGSIEWSKGIVKKSFLSAIPLSDLRLIDPGRLAEIIKPLSNKNRIRVMLLLLDGDRSASEISGVTGLEGGQLYHHLKELLFSNLIESVERGRYRLTEKGLTVLRILSALALTPELTVHPRGVG